MRIFIIIVAVVLSGAWNCLAALEVDLGSDTAWTASLDGKPARAIKVPGGGWNSDVQQPPIQIMTEVRDHVMYERKVSIPAEAKGQVVKVMFGAVNYGAEVFLDGKKVGEHHGSLMPFEVDLTGVAVAGSEQMLRVKAYHRLHYTHDGKCDLPVGWDYPAGGDEKTTKESKAWSNWAGQSRVAYGITKYVKLVVLPPVYVQDWFVKTSVTKKQWSCELWIANATESEKTIEVSGAFSSWNKRDWKYPAIGDVKVTVPAKGVEKVTMGPVAWELGAESYWWPNIPFREDYAAQLHYLDLTVKEGGKVWQSRQQRFGFVEHGEGPFYYTVNGVRVTGFSDATAEGQTSFYDSYSRAPAWLPPTKSGTGCPETWRRYLRVGINSNRLHCSLPTEYMMESADEVGFMLIPEAPIWGNNLSRFHEVYAPQCIREMAHFCRNNPSVVRYSLTNEVREKRDAKWPWRALVDAATEVDDTRPLVFELHGQGNGRVDGVKIGHAYIMEHYTGIDKSGKFIRGMGEHVWSTDGMGPFAITSQQMRVYDWAYFAPWSWVNYWPNFLEGMNHNLHIWKHNNHADRKDGVDGWGSPAVKAVQKALHPYLVVDQDVLESNPKQMIGTGCADAEMKRNIAVFNSALSGGRFELKWSAHWDSAGGEAVAEGVDGPFEIEPGFHAIRPIAIKVPALAGDQKKRQLYLVLTSYKDGKEVFSESGLSFDVYAGKLLATAKFIGSDDKSGGDWEGKFGSEGYELFGHESKLPKNVSMNWEGDSLHMYEKATDAKRALAYFVNPPTGKDRVAAGRYGNAMKIILEVGETPRRVSFYLLDWDKKNRKSRVTLRGLSGELLDKRSVEKFADGKYLSWTMQGTVQVLIEKENGDNATISGIFFDPAK